jgi:hypothetical protein
VQAGGEWCVKWEIAELVKLHMQGIVCVGKSLKVMEGELTIRVGTILAGIVLLELIEISGKLDDILRGGE